MRTLVTGAAGFIGSTLVDGLLKDGHQVVGLDNLATGSLANLEQARQHAGFGGRFTFVKSDVRHPELTDIVVAAAPKVVFHLAAQIDVRKSVVDPLFDAATNVLGTINLLEACRCAEVPRIVYAASGGSRYGAPASLPVAEDAPVVPLSPYATAKVAGELYLRTYQEMYGVAATCLALANVYGPRQDPHGEAGVVTIFGSALIAGRPTTIYGDGNATRDYVYVDDVVGAFLLAAAAPADSTGIFNIGTGVQTTVNQLHRLVAAVVGVPDRPNHGPARIGEAPASALDPVRARRVLGWSPGTGLAGGVRLTIDWLRAMIQPELAIPALG